LSGGREIKNKRNISQFSGQISNPRTLEYAALRCSPWHSNFLLKRSTIFKIFITSMGDCIKIYLNKNIVYTTNIVFAQLLHLFLQTLINVLIHWDGYAEGLRRVIAIYGSL
jgi:hypothetical protein